MRQKLCIFLILLSYLGNSQGLNGELGFNDNYDQSSKGVVCVDEYSYLVKFQKTSSFFSFCTLFKIDTLENIIWSVPVTPLWAEYIDVYEIIPSEACGIYLMGFGMPTCDVGQDCFWYVQKYDSTGRNIWTKLWSDFNCYNLKLSGLSLNSSNQLFVNYNDTSGSFVCNIGAGGITLDSLKISRSDIEGFDDLSGFEKVGYKQDSLFGFDTTGNILISIIFNTPIQGIEALNDTLYVLTQDSIYSFDNNLLAIYGADVAGYTGYSHLKLINSTIQFVSEGTTTQSIISLDDQLQLISALSIPIELDSGTHKDFNQFHFSTAIDYSLTWYRTIRYLDYSLNSNQNVFVNTTDIGVIELEPTHVSAVEDPYYQDVYHISIEADVLIKNFGPNTLNNCRINHRILGPWICSDVFFTEQYFNLNSAAYDSMWISLGLVHYEVNYFPDDSIERNICIYTSHPNFKTDLNVPNDQYCESVFIAYTGLNETELDELSLYPNPTDGILNIQIPNNNDALCFIYSIQGSLLMSGDLNSNEIDISSLFNGVYILKILFKDNRTSIVRSIIKK